MSRLRHLELDRFELLLLALFVALSLWTVGLALWQVIVHHRIWTGSENLYFEDGFQSMMWIQGILHHGASPDLYVLGSTPADYFQPLVAISAGLTGLGLAPYLALLLWKPVAVLGVFLAARAYIGALIEERWARRAALALALFFAWGLVIGDALLLSWSWGYPFALISLACALAALLAYDRDRGAGRLGILPAFLGLMTSWLHPWQGEILILILLVSELVCFLRRQPVRLTPLLLTVACTAIPLGYFAALVQFDPVWSREREVAIRSYSLAHVFGALWPLLIAALLAYRLRARGFLATSVRVWPFAALAVFLFSEWKGSGPTHALLGITVPLAILAVEGVRKLPWRGLLERAPAFRALALPVVAVLTIPATIGFMEHAQEHLAPRPFRSNFIGPGENAALAYLASDQQPGGVLAPFFLGMLVPPLTARQTYVGNCYWSEPSCHFRSRRVRELIHGQLSPAGAQAFIERVKARFVLLDCRAQAGALAGEIAPITSSIKHFSCATLFVIRPRGP